MQHTIETSKPFSFAQTLTFIDRFPACRGHIEITGNRLRAAVTIQSRPVVFAMTESKAGLAVEIDDAVPLAAQREVVAAASNFVGATDDVAALYRASEGDRHFARLIPLLHGLHHVRFLSLGDIAVYSVLMQRAPITIAAALKRKFLARFGKPIDGLGALPDLDELATLDADDIAAAIRHRPKAERIALVVRGVHAIGEHFLRTAPYAEARDALLEIKGIGPFSAAAILLRGLGRMDELPWLPAFQGVAHELYGRRVEYVTIARRYQHLIGYWSFYLMTGVPRLSASATVPV